MAACQGGTSRPENQCLLCPVSPTTTYLQEGMEVLLQCTLLGYKGVGLTWGACNLQMERELGWRGLVQDVVGPRTCCL